MKVANWESYEGANQEGKEEWENKGKGNTKMEIGPTS